MPRQPKKTNSKDYYACPKCKGTFLDVTLLRTQKGDIIGREYDCNNPECNYSWNDRGEELQ